jgi:N-acetylmuramoyl-L-alanine amidase
VSAALLLCALFAAHAPGEIVISAGGHEARVPVLADAGGAPIISAPLLLSALNGSVRVSDGWAEIIVARQPFRFLVGAPLYIFSRQLQPLAAPASLRRDTLYLPLQFVAEVLPYYLSERYRYDGHGRLEVLGPVAAAAPRAPEPRRLPNGLRPGHSVTIDPGHGGIDPGNPGIFFPRGMREKDVTLAVGLLLRDELRQRGIAIRMTRTSDTLIALGDRGGYCTQTCELFVSLHVNSLARRPGYTEIRGPETYFLAEARTEDAKRVAKMENDAVRFEADQGDAGTAGGLDFILKDLQLNEHLRESARAAELVQRRLRGLNASDSRGVKQAGFMVLTTARRPAILVEMGYSTNPDDGRLLTTRSSQKAIASALADAVVQYLLEYERKTTTDGAPGVGQ